MNNKFPGKDITDSDLVSKFPLAAKMNNSHVVEIDGARFDAKHVWIMAGPNTVENEEMINKIASKINSVGLRFIRGGCYKPLTFPYRSSSYYQTGLDGLKWLSSAAKANNLASVTELLDVRDTDIVARYADVIQIGARNMQNFPLITEAAKTGKPILLKRHFGCSLRDLYGAAEYALLESNKNIILCERGVSVPHTHRETSRFLLDLPAIPASQEFSWLPIIADPSHATFRREWVPSMAKASVAAGANGVMIEIHPDPENAAVDPLQSISLEAFADLVSDLQKIASAIGTTLG